MSAMKKYFKYRFVIGGCGFPYVTIEGSFEDRTKINTKLNDLTKYKFEWYTHQISKILDKIIETKKGNANTKFWGNIIRFKGQNGIYDPKFIDGLFTKFFPYNFYVNIIQGTIQ